MNFLEQLRSKAGYFYIRTPFGGDNNAVVQDGTKDGHLRTGRKADSEYRKWLIYPEAGKGGQLRIIQKARPDHAVTLEPGRVKVLPFQDSDRQRFVLKNTTPPKNAPADAQGVQWYKIKMVAEHDKGFGINSVGINFLSDYSISKSNDRTKFWFEPVDVVAPDASKMQATKIPMLAPKPAHFDINTKNVTEWGKQRVSVEAIPATVINTNDYSIKMEQMADNPYYYLECWTMWIKKEETTLTHGTVKSTIQITDAFSRTDYESIERTIGHMFKMEADFGYDPGQGGGPKGSVKLTYQFNQQTKSLRGTSNTVDWSRVKTDEYTPPNPPADGSYNTERVWIPLYRYLLKDGKENVVDSWDYEDSSDKHFQHMKY